MLSRREVLAASVAGGLSTLPASAEPVESVETQSDRDVQLQLVKQVAGIGSTLDRAFFSNSLAFGTIGRLRDQMIQHFRGAQKFPDFIDVGVGVFMELYDWHVRHRQQLVVTRNADNRYWMQFMFTTLVLRHEVDPAFIGIAYDKS